MDEKKIKSLVDMHHRSSDITAVVLMEMSDSLDMHNPHIFMDMSEESANETVNILCRCMGIT